MNFTVTFRHSKLARHILLLFFICALLPLLSLSFFSYFKVTQNLTEHGFRMLQQNTKSVSLSIYERLLLLETEMRFLANHLFDSVSGQVLKGIKERHQPNIKHFKALGLINNEGIQHQISGTIDNPPPLELDRKPPFNYNKAGILIQEIAKGQPSVFMLVGLEQTELGDDFLIAEINPDFLWGIGAADSLPPMTEICVLDSSGELLITTMPQPRDLLANIDHFKNNSAWDQFKWKHKGSRYLASSRELFLQSRFQVPGWKVVLSQSKADALSPVMEFKIIFALVLLSSILIVFLLSTNYIRKSLTPLEKLKEGTQLIAGGNFKSRVDINSGDEFEELATAFNKMSERLNHQFKELSMLAKIGRIMANILSKDKLTQAASNAIGNYLDFDRGMILMVDGRDNRLYYAAGFGYSGEDIRQFQNYELEAFDNQSNDPISSAFIEQKPISLTNPTVTETERPEQLNSFFKSTGSQYIICIPIVYERESLGVLVLERANSKESNRSSDEKLLTGVASQLAVSISNITSYNKLMESEARLQQAQKMEAIGTLAGGIAHDFNNILSGIMGYAQLGMMENDKDSDNYRWLQGVQEASDRASELVKQILTFSRQGQQEMAPIQIHLIIKEALKLLRATLTLDIDIQEKISNATGMVLADSTQIHQVVMNLCTNAYHSMLDKGGTLEVILEPEDLSSSRMTEQFDLQPGPYLKLTISDTGCGMNDATLNKIFDPYFTTKEADKGTGLGLSVVHGIVESHGGAISVHSEPGQGTRFEVLFPQIPVDKKTDNRGAESIPTGTESILFVDDEEAVAETGKSILERLGYRVEAHTDPQKALDKFSHHGHDFDLVITDMSMPHLSGEELSQRLMEIRPDIPILLCTGYSDKLNAENADAMGIKKFLIKPLEMDKLANSIREVLDEDSPSIAS